MAHAAIRTARLGRQYEVPRKPGAPRGDGPARFTALADVSLEIPHGELFGLLGSNGAGKTTLIKILTTLLAPSSGQAFVDGLDVVADPEGVRRRINMVSGGESSGYGILTVAENLWLFTQLYGVPRREARKRIDGILAAVNMTEWAQTKISHLSTGLRQRMNFCRGFVTDPKILFLDEPTLGLDVNAARTLRHFVRAWMDERPERTLVLTTHYLMEADELCDRVSVIDRGRVLACDTPAALKRRVQRFPIFELALKLGGDDWEKIGNLPGVHQYTAAEDADAVRVKVILEEEAAIGAVVQQIVQTGGRILSLQKVEPTLEDVFVKVVGHGVQGVAA